MKLTCVLALCLVVGVFGCNPGKKASVTGEGDKKLEVTAPGNTTITQGKEEKITVKIARTKFDEPVEIDVNKTTLPKGVTIDNAKKTIEKGAKETTFVLTAASDAGIEDGQVVTISAKFGTMKVDADFKLNVKKGVAPELKVTAPSDTSITQGKEHKFTVKISRTGFDEPVEIDVNEATLPKGVKIDNAKKTIDPGAKETTFILSAAADADVKEGQVIKISAKSGAMKADVDFKLNVKKSS